MEFCFSFLTAASILFFYIFFFSFGALSSVAARVFEILFMANVIVGNSADSGPPKQILNENNGPNWGFPISIIHAFYAS